MLAFFAILAILLIPVVIWLVHMTVLIQSQQNKPTYQAIHINYTDNRVGISEDFARNLLQVQGQTIPQYRTIEQVSDAPLLIEGHISE